MEDMTGPFCGVYRGEHLLSEPPRRMKSEYQGTISRDRPEAAAERSEDRVRTVAKPEALDSGPGELCVGQEVASKAGPSRHPASGTRKQCRHRSRQLACGAPLCEVRDRQAIKRGEGRRAKCAAWREAAVLCTATCGRAISAPRQEHLSGRPGRSGARGPAHPHISPRSANESERPSATIR